MIKSLSIRNYGIIQSHELDFGTGLHVITGETGAGKSLILGALGLLMGERYDGHPALDSTQKCVIEAEFENGQPDVAEWLEEQGFDPSMPLILRRELSQPSRTRCFIQDSPASLSQLRDISYWLLDICGQHDTRELKSVRIHLEYLDEFARCRDLATRYRKAYQRWKRLTLERDALEDRTSRATRELELNQYYLEEIRSFGIKGPGELAELEARQQLEDQSKSILESLQMALWELDGNEQGLLARIAVLQKQMRSYCELSPKARELYECYEQAASALKDALQLSGQWSESFTSDPGEQKILIDRIDKLNQLLAKHQVMDLPGLLEKAQTMAMLSTEAENSLQVLESLRLQSEAAFAEVCQLAESLHEQRAASAPLLKSAMQKLMPSAGFAHAQFEVELQRKTELAGDTAGYNYLEFKFSANPGQAVSSLQKVASGGELSRLTLCLRTACRSREDASVVVFDEIDTGISGQTALGIGRLLKEMAETQQQILLITHLPQIAAAANRHFLVKKQSSERATISRIEALSDRERIQVLACMMAGSEAGEAAHRQAEELIKLYEV